MALMINIKWPYGGHSTGYELKAESTVHSIIRFAVQAPLPAGEAGEESNIFTLDLGMAKEEITIQGVVDTTGSPSKADLEEVGRTWWNYGANDPTQLPILTISSGYSYYGSIKTCDFRQEGALEDRWQFTLTFLVNRKV